MCAVKFKKLKTLLYMKYMKTEYFHFIRMVFVIFSRTRMNKRVIDRGKRLDLKRNEDEIVRRRGKESESGNAFVRGKGRGNVRNLLKGRELAQDPGLAQVPEDALAAGRDPDQGKGLVTDPEKG